MTIYQTKDIMMSGQNGNRNGKRQSKVLLLLFEWNPFSCLLFRYSQKFSNISQMFSN